MIVSHRAIAEVLEIAASGVCGVVDENVEAAEPRHRKADQPAADLFAGQVAVEILRLAAGRLDTPDRLGAIGAVAAVHHDVRPELRETLRDTAADAGGRSGYDRHFAGEAAHGITIDQRDSPPLERSILQYAL